MGWVSCSLGLICFGATRFRAVKLGLGVTVWGVCSGFIRLFDGDRAAMTFGDVLHERKPNAASTHGSRVFSEGIFSANEALEDPLAISGRDPLAAIRDSN